MIYYVYKLLHNQTGHFYFGSRKCDPLYETHAKYDLGVKYKTSSKYVSEMGFDNFTSEIIFTFQSNENDEAFWAEQELISIHQHDPLLLNRVYFDKSVHKKFCTRDKKLSDAHKKKISKGGKGKRKHSSVQRENMIAMNVERGKRIRNDYEASPKRCKECFTALSWDHKKKLYCSDTCRKNALKKMPSVWKDISKTEDHRRKISEGNIGKSRGLGVPKSLEHRKNISAGTKGKGKENKRLAALNRPKTQCPHCGKSADAGNYKQHHGNACKALRP